MKELMRLYLDENYNSVHRKKTKFGIVTLDNHGYIYLGDITTSLSNVFSITLNPLGPGSADVGNFPIKTIP
jgi:hypothetical protein